MRSKDERRMRFFLFFLCGPPFPTLPVGRGVLSGPLSMSTTIKIRSRLLGEVCLGCWSMGSW